MGTINSGVRIIIRGVCSPLDPLTRGSNRSGDEEGVVAASDGLVEAAFLVQVGAEDLQMAERVQVLEVGVLGHVIWGSDLIKRGLNNYPYIAHIVSLF